MFAAISLLAFAIFQVRTEQGTLLIQIEDPAVQALLEKNGLVVRDKDTNRTWTITTTQKKSLPTGQYAIDGKPNVNLIVTDDADVELTTDTFTLKNVEKSESRSHWKLRRRSLRRRPVGYC